MTFRSVVRENTVKIRQKSAKKPSIFHKQAGGATRAELQKNQLSKQRTYGPETPLHHLPLFAVEMVELGINLSSEQWLDSSHKEYCSQKQDTGTTLVYFKKSSHSSFWLLCSSPFPIGRNCPLRALGQQGGRGRSQNKVHGSWSLQVLAVYSVLSLRTNQRAQSLSPPSVSTVKDTSMNSNCTSAVGWQSADIAVRFTVISAKISFSSSKVFTN